MRRNALTQSLDLFPIGNCAASALVDRAGRYVWACVPRVDGDPFFSGLLSGKAADAEDATGIWAIEVEGATQITQAYLRNTPILRTEIVNADGAAVEIIDFSPRYRHLGRQYRPLAFVRIVRPAARLAARLGLAGQFSQMQPALDRLLRNLFIPMTFLGFS